MTNRNRHSREESNPDLLGGALKTHFNKAIDGHLTHVHACLSIMGIVDPDDRDDDGDPTLQTHAFGGGHPELLAEMLVSAITRLNKDVDGFKRAFSKAIVDQQLKEVLGSIVGEMKGALAEHEEKKAMERAAPTVKEVLERMKNASKGS